MLAEVVIGVPDMPTLPFEESRASELVEILAELVIEPLLAMPTLVEPVTVFAKLTVAVLAVLVAANSTVLALLIQLIIAQPLTIMLLHLLLPL